MNKHTSVTKSQNVYQWRIQIWKETFEMSHDFPFEPSEKIRSDIIFNINKRFEKTIYSIENIDTIVAGETLKSKGLNPLLLNFADDNNPGGAVDTGSGAQEESLFRRTNYCATLEENLYPINYYEGIYSPCVTVFRDTEDKNNRFLKKSFQVSFVAVPGLFCPSLTPEKRLNPGDVARLRIKIRLILQIAYKKGHDSLVLGALGCGAWRNPPQHVAEIFKEILKEYDRVFKEIVFACLDAGDSKGRVSNYEVFTKVFQDTL